MCWFCSSGWQCLGTIKFKAQCLCPFTLFSFIWMHSKHNQYVHGVYLKYAFDNLVQTKMWCMGNWQYNTHTYTRSNGLQKKLNWNFVWLYETKFHPHNYNVVEVDPRQIRYTNTNTDQWDSTKEKICKIQSNGWLYRRTWCGNKTTLCVRVCVFSSRSKWGIKSSIDRMKLKFQ